MDQSTVDALYRNNLYYFVLRAFNELYPTRATHYAKHIKLLCHTLQEMLEHPGECPLISMPPRYAKSFVTSICFVAWAMGRNPELKILVASYGDALANEHALTFRNLVTSNWFQDLFPAFELKNEKANHLKTTHGGERFAISVAGAATGFGADIIIVDDIIKAADANSQTKRDEAKRYLDETLFSRLDRKDRGHIVAIQQRFHEDDPAAYMETKGFTKLCLKAIAEENEEWDLGDEIWIRNQNEALFPELETIETLEAIRLRITPSVFSAQYQQNPINPGGNIISWHNIQRYAANEVNYADYVGIIQSWDTACTNHENSDYSACATLALHLYTQKWHLIDMHRSKPSYIELERKAIEFARKRKPICIVVECANTGYALCNKLRSELMPHRPNPNDPIVYGMTPRLSKEQRFFTHQNWFEEGKILLPDNAPWLPDFQRELIAFPSGRYDDQIDAVLQALELLETPRGQAIMNRDPETGRLRTNRRPRRYAT